MAIETTPFTENRFHKNPSFLDWMKSFAFIEVPTTKYRSLFTQQSSATHQATISSTFSDDADEISRNFARPTDHT
ncbi:hypothetical protein QR680_002687 [Steinernema hermaphroditum]|uniref:Uncharacterized protein n=1 Tax=Steinernema hermaphroditum TaxID=289476 RepID=A0AA39H4I7_9BILA|nr:hypothetical protein QR680_002687 [Steinernema hermaphroditum]